MKPTAAHPHQSRAPALRWKRDLIASIVLASGVFVGTCAFAGVWAVTHPALFNL